MADKRDKQTLEAAYAAYPQSLDWASERRLGFRRGAEWADKNPSLETKVTFYCISKDVTMTIGELIKYYTDQECADVADECGF